LTARLIANDTATDHRPGIRITDDVRAAIPPSMSVIGADRWRHLTEHVDADMKTFGHFARAGRINELRFAKDLTETHRKNRRLGDAGVSTYGQTLATLAPGRR
jgi:hypothetical protein